MSVQSLGHFIVRMTVDPAMLRKYLADPSALLPVGTEAEDLAKVRDAAGDLTLDEIELIREGNWEEIFLHLAEAGIKPIGEDQTNYP